MTYWCKRCICTEFGPFQVNAATIYQHRVTQDRNSNREYGNKKVAPQRKSIHDSMLGAFQTMGCFLRTSLALMDTSVHFVNFNNCNWQFFFFFSLLNQLIHLVKCQKIVEKCRWQFSITQTVTFITFCFVWYTLVNKSIQFSSLPWKNNWSYSHVRSSKTEFWQDFFENYSNN